MVFCHDNHLPRRRLRELEQAKAPTRCDAANRRRGADQIPPHPRGRSWQIGSNKMPAALLHRETLALVLNSDSDMYLYLWTMPLLGRTADESKSLPVDLIHFSLLPLCSVVS